MITTSLKYVPFVYERDAESCRGLTLRAADLKTIDCFGFTSVAEAVEFNFIKSNLIWTITNQGGEVYGVAGVGDEGNPWMFAEERIKEDTAGFFKGSHTMIAKMLEYHDLLWNYIWDKHFYSIKWLKQLGFEFHYDETRVVGEEKFIYYEKGSVL